MKGERGYVSPCHSQRAKNTYLETQTGERTKLCFSLTSPALNSLESGSRMQRVSNTACRLRSCYCTLVRADPQRDAIHGTLRAPHKTVVMLVIHA